MEKEVIDLSMLSVKNTKSKKEKVKKETTKKQTSKSKVSKSKSLDSDFSKMSSNDVIRQMEKTKEEKIKEDTKKSLFTEETCYWQTERDSNKFIIHLYRDVYDKLNNTNIFNKIINSDSLLNTYFVNSKSVAYDYIIHGGDNIETICAWASKNCGVKIIKKKG